MKGTSLVIALLLLACNCSPARQQDASAPKQLVFDVRIVQENPAIGLLVREPSVITKTTLITLEEKTCSHTSGGDVPLLNSPESIPLGLSITCSPSKIQDGKIKLDFGIGRSYIAGKNSDGYQVRSTSTRLVSTVTLGKQTKIAWNEDGSKSPMWVEVIVVEAQQ